MRLLLDLFFGIGDREVIERFTVGAEEEWGCE